MREFLKSLHRQIFDLTQVEPQPEDWARVPQPEMGDLAFPCFKVSKALKKAPPQTAQELQKSLHDAGPTKTWISSLEAKGPYLNIFLNTKTLWNSLCLRSTQSRFFPIPPLASDRTPQTIVIDFSSPNVAKEMGLHHLRSTALGHSLARIAETSGHKPVRLNYLGDWGTSFGKLLLGLEKFGNESELDRQGLEYMLELYVKFNQAEKLDPSLTEAAKAAFSKLEKGDAEYRRLWKLFREISIREFKKLYSRLGVDFDFFDGESLYVDQLDPVVGLIQEKIGTRMSEGALVCDLPGKEIPVLLKKDDGASLYITRDLAAIEDRWNRFHFDHAWYVVAIQQKLHFEQLFGVTAALGKPYSGRAEHVSFGMLLFGNKSMKSREGNVLFLKDVLDEAESRALKILEEKNPNLSPQEKSTIAAKVARGALLFGDLSQHRNHDVRFDWEKALSFEGDTAPFIQYTYARCCSLIEKVRSKNPEVKNLGSQPEPLPDSLHQIKAIREILKEILFFETYLEKALAEKDPSQIAKSLIDVAKAMNRLYHDVRFVDETDKNRIKGLIDVTQMVQRTIQTGLYILGIETVERM